MVPTTAIRLPTLQAEIAPTSAQGISGMVSSTAAAAPTPRTR